jgi:hypothetical protein
MSKFFRVLACELAVAGVVAITVEKRVKKIEMNRADPRLLPTKFLMSKVYQFQLLLPPDDLPICPHEFENSH